MKQIQLTQNKIALLDDEDFDKISKYHWIASKVNNKSELFYAVTSIRDKEGKNRTTYMHRMIMNPKKKQVIDHINRNGLDNRKENLRACSHYQNILNSKKHIKCVSRYKGVWFDKERNKWVTEITVKGKNKFLGRFETEKEAGIKYNEYAKKYFKEFSRLNEIDEDSNDIQTNAIQKSN